jgi:heme exporter protein B
MSRVGPSVVQFRAGFWEQAVTVLQKDLRAELRNRAAVNSILLFAVTALVVVGYAVGPAAMGPGLKAALLWVVLFFSAFSGLAHVFLHEEEASTVTALRLSAQPAAVFAGKMIFNLLLLGVIGLIVVPLYIVMVRVEIARPFAFLGVVVTGAIGLGSAATIVAAIIAKAHGKGALYGAIGFPVLLPLLMMAVRATQLSMTAQSAGELRSLMVGLLSFAVMLITASSLLFGAVWED